MEHIALEDIVKDAWDKSISDLDRVKSLGKEFLGNFKTETGCITACALGEVIGASLAYYGGEFAKRFSENPQLQSIADYSINNSNLLGIPLALAFGSAYVYNHLNKDARAHGMKPSISEVAMWGATTESVCIGTAVGLEYYAMNNFGNLNAGPLNPENLLVEGMALLTALPIANIAMSSLTFPKKNEAGRIVSDKKLLHPLAERLGEDYGLVEIFSKKNIFRKYVSSLKLKGTKGEIEVQEKKLPKLYHNNHNPKDSSIYIIKTPRAKYSIEAKKSAEGIICNALRDIGNDSHFHVQNPFMHDHSSHSHAH